MKIHLIQSALNQNTETELWAFPEGRSQGGAARHRREEASLRGLTGLRIRPCRETSYRPTGEVRSPAPAAGFPAATILAVSGRPRGAVLPAIRSGTRTANLTGELPRRPRPPAGVRADYKLDTKGPPHAAAAGTASRWPRPQGTQQRQSRSAPRRAERQNLNQFVNRPVLGTVSPNGTGHPMAGRDLLPASARSAKKHPEQRAAATRTKRLRWRLP
jgi:hypothetical protein